METAIIENKQITECLKHIIKISYNEERVYLIVDYLNGRFTIEKTFQNNHIGLSEMQEASRLFDTEEKVIGHFNLEKKV